LRARTALDVRFASTGVVAVPGTIYMAPPDHHVLVERGALRLFRGPKEHHARPAINPLFRSAALDCGPRAVGVILTGMLDDGAAGLRAIKLCGGTTVVQDPAHAAAPSMPRAALANGPVDHVVAIDALAGLLNRLALPLKEIPPVTAPKWLRIEHGISLGNGDIDDMKAVGTASGFTCPDCGGALFEVTERSPLRFLCHTGHAFSLRSLLQAHSGASEEVMWESVRALQEKEALLNRLAREQSDDAPHLAAAARDEARQVATLCALLKKLLKDLPASIELTDEDTVGDAQES
jgi:two-component system chemotaxis response regulator CheB